MFTRRITDRLHLRFLGLLEIVDRIAEMHTKAAAAVASLGLLVSIAGLFAYFSDSTSRYVVTFASFTPFTIAAAVIGGIVAAVCRRWILFAASLAAVVTGASLFGPMYVADAAAEGDRRAESRTINVMQSNLMLGLADPTDVVRHVDDGNIDVLTVQELTESAIERLDAAGLNALLPYRFTRPTREGGGGAGIYSRHPLTNERELPGFLLSNLVADVRVGTAEPIRMYSVHPIPPYPSPTPVWASEMDLLKSEVASSMDRTHVIVSGDFNSTRSHSRFRNIVETGFEDAAASTGSGLIPTYPTDKGYPAVVGIDHILTRGAVATSLERITVAGSDHHGLMATVAMN